MQHLTNVVKTLYSNSFTRGYGDEFKTASYTQGIESGACNTHLGMFQARGVFLVTDETNIKTGDNTNRELQVRVLLVCA